MDKSNGLKLIIQYAQYAPLVVAVPFIIGLLRYYRLNKLQKWILLIVLINLVNEVLSQYISRQGQENLWLYHLYIPILLFMIFRIYRHALINSFRVRAFDYFLIAMLAFCVANSLWIQPLSQFNSNSVSMANLSFIFLAMVYLYSLLKNPAFERLEKMPLFWFSVGSLVYYSSTLMLYVVFNNILERSVETIVQSWWMNITLFILYHLILSICLLISSPFLEPQK